MEIIVRHQTRSYTLASLCSIRYKHEPPYRRPRIQPFARKRSKLSLCTFRYKVIWKQQHDRDKN